MKTDKIFFARNFAFRKKTEKGSVLAYSLIILSMMLAIAVSLSTSTIIDKKSASSTESSTQSIQTADSGLQIALKRINDKISPPSPATSQGTDAINKADAFPNCGPSNPADGNVSGTPFKLSFYSDAGCTAAMACTAQIKDIACVKSVGTNGNTVRAASMAVTPDATKLLLHADNIGDPTKFFDLSPNPKTITKHGDTKQSNGQTKGGFGSSALLDGTGDYLSTPSSNDFDFGTGNFVIDWWENPTSNTHLAFARESRNYQAFLVFKNDRKVYMSSNGTSWDVTDPVNGTSGRSLGTVAQGSWHHYAIVRSGNNFYTYKDGSQQDSWVSPLPLFTGSGPLQIGRYDNNIPADPQNPFYSAGYFDEFRISKGTDRGWTSNFIPEAFPYN